MFLGTYKFNFSDKNERGSSSFRILLPKKFRKELGQEEKFYLVSGIDGEIWGFNVKQWRKEAENRLKIPITEARGRILRRGFFSQAEECALDSQGRFIISKELIDYAGIEKEVLLVGGGDHFEIWKPEFFRRSFKDVTEKI